jgi:cytosine/adenosine deaminase-related metal-dependent hydrolase
MKMSEQRKRPESALEIVEGLEDSDEYYDDSFHDTHESGEEILLLRQNDARASHRPTSSPPRMMMIAHFLSYM